MKLDDIFPEREPVRNGDPFIARLAELDDFITDYKDNGQLLGVEEWAAAATVLWLEEELAKYQIATLSRWYEKGTC